MNKVIIVTRTNEYEGCEFINPEESYIPRCNKLAAFLNAVNRWKEELKKDNEAEAYKRVMQKELKGTLSHANLIEVVTELMKKPFEPNSEWRNPYSHYSKDAFDVYCVWCDRLKIIEIVEPFEVFIESICDDIGINFEVIKKNDTESVLLFVHDNQIGEEGDAVLIDDYDERVKSNYSDFLKRFKRVARFKHIQGKTIFSELIWNGSFSGNCTWLKNYNLSINRRRI